MDDAVERINRTLMVQDAVLRGLIENHFDRKAWSQLPKWRQLMLARVAAKAGVITRGELDELTRVARFSEELPTRSDGD